MKTLAVKEKRSAPSIHRSQPSRFGHRGPEVKAQQAEIHRILRSTGAQAKLTIGEPEGKYEQETDHMVVDLPVSAISDIPPGGPGGEPPLQRAESEESEEELQRQPEEEEEEPIQAKLIQRQPDNEEEEEPVQAKRIQRQMSDMRVIRPSRFGYVGSKAKAQQAEIHRILRSTGAQAKLTIGQSNDKYEQEADRVAEQVMRMSDSDVAQRQLENEEEEEETVQAKPLADQITPLVQRQVEPEGEEEESLQEKSLLQRQPENEEEEETLQAKPLADQITPLVQRQVEPEEEEEEEEPIQAKLGDGGLLQRQEEEPEEEEELIQAKAMPGQTPDIQRTCPECEEEQGLQRQPMEEDDEVQASGSIPSTQAASQAINNPSLASPLRADVRSILESRMGVDLSGVRVHEDSAAHKAAASINAKAFTHKNDIWLGAGQSQSELHLMAHETTHVVQQGATSQTSSAVTQTSAPAIQRMSWSDVGSSILGLMTGVLLSVLGGADAVKRTFMNHLRRFIRRIPGYRLLSVVLGQDPITRDPVLRNGRNFIEAGLDVIPGGRLLQRKLQQQGTLDQAAAWLDEQLEQLDFDPATIVGQFRRLWDRLGIADLRDPLAVLRQMRDIFQPPIDRLFRFARNVAARLLQMVKDYLVSTLINFIRERTRAYPLVRAILGQDPITGEEVPRSGMNLIRGFMELSEAGAEKLRQMEETGTLQRAANWIGNAVGRITGNVRRIIAAFQNLWREVTIENLMDPTGTFTRIFSSFAEPIVDIMNFLIEVGIQVLRFIKDALIRRLVAFARTVRGYPLLTVILGRDPFSGERVPRTAENFIRGFLSLLSDGEERFRNLQQSGAIDRAMTWLNNEVERLNLSWEAVRALFVQAWEDLSIYDLVNPIAAFERMVNLFRAPVGRIIRFAAAVGMKILEFVFEGIMGAGGTRVLNILKRARDTFMTIINDPVGFLRNLINAVVQGFRRFGQNIRQHLIAGLTGWLFGALQGAGLQLPERWDLRGIISLVLQILGLTYQRIRPRLVRLLGERTVGILEGTFEVVRLLVTEGPVAIWRRIVEYAGNLRDRVMEGIRNWVITRVVMAAVTRLATMWNPVGAVVQAIIAIYNTIMFFIERINQIMAVVESICNSISTIASGNISAAANFVEQTMARTLPVIISFMARLLGLGGISNTIRRIIARIRQPIDRAIDRVVRWIARQARRLVRRGRAAVAGIVAWWRTRKQFRDRAGESHVLSFRGTGRNSQLMIASSLQTIEEYLNGLSIERSDPQFVRLTRARQLVSEIQTITRSEVERSEARQIEQKITHLSELLIVIGGDTIRDIPQPAEWNFSSGSQEQSSSVEKLSTLTSRGGSTPSGSTPAFEYLRSRNMTSRDRSDRWVRMHLISERVGGPGDTRNWVPAPNSVNTGAKVTSFESATNGLVERRGRQNQPNVVWIRTIARLRSPSPSFGDVSGFPENVSFRAGLYFRGERDWQKDTSPIVSEDVPVHPPTGGEVPSLSQPSYTALSAIEHPGVVASSVFSRTTVERMRRALETGSSTFGTKPSFIARLRAVTDNTRWQNKITNEIAPAVDTLHAANKIRIR